LAESDNFLVASNFTFGADESYTSGEAVPKSTLEMGKLACFGVGGFEKAF
jgi:hypothetical protein